MAINRFDIATLGARACRKTLAILGVRNFCVEIQVEKRAYYPDQLKWEEWNDPNLGLRTDYVIHINVKYKNRTWKLSRRISEKLYNNIKIIVDFVKLENIKVEIKAAFKKILNNIKILANLKDN